MKLPFETQDVIEEMVNRPLVLSKNMASSNEFNISQEITFLQDGKVSAVYGRWEVIDGVLRVMSDKGQLITEFRTLETRKGSVYAVGRNVLEPTGPIVRPIIHVKKPIGDNFGICISSHVNYEKDAVPRILRSLEGDGFDMSKVVVVIGNDPTNDGKKEVNPETKVTTVRRKGDIFGLSALGNIPDCCARPYWLLLHDTCEATPGFVANIAGLDVGLNPDIVLIRPTQEKVEFGLYESKFAMKLANIPHDTHPFDYFKIATQIAMLVEVVVVPFKKEPEKDVYGKGIRRETVNFGVGLKKYRAKASDIRNP